MKQKVRYLFLLPMLVCIGAFAQTHVGRIAGVVMDASSGEPLAGATLFVEEVGEGVTTDGRGKFSFTDIPLGTYTLTVKFVGYQTQTRKVVVSAGGGKQMTIPLRAESQALAEVVVMGKSKARKIREQAMPVSVISMKQLQGTVSDVQSILAKTVGVTIRSTGGTGSASRISLRGLEGKRIGFFVDETPVGDQSDYIDLNDIPIDMIDRIEIYKGIVPAKFGGSSMGGAINVVIREYPDRYADVSIAHESFNVNKAQAVLKRNIKESGVVLGVGGTYTYADNHYTMESPYVKGLKIKRTHDNYRKFVLGGSVKARKWWFDELELEPVCIDTYHEIQGIKTDIRQAHTRSRLYALSNKLKKTDCLFEGLDLDMHTMVAYTQYKLADTAKVFYDWEGNAYPSPSAYGGELGTRYASDSDNRKLTFSHKLNLQYLIHPQHTVNVNSVFTLANGYPSDSIKVKSLGKRTDFDSRMHSWVVGLNYDFHTPGDRFLNSLTGRYYRYSMHTLFQNIYLNIPPEKIHLTKTSLGLSEAMRFRITPSWMAKLSGGYDVRIPSERELLGDGCTITPSERLLPERNFSLNVGLLYDRSGSDSRSCRIELSGYYMYLHDMIRFVKGMLGAQYQNFGEMRTLGVEFEARVDLLPFLYGYGNLTYQDLRDVRDYEDGTQLPNATKGKRMPNIPYLMSNAGLEFHKENLFGGHGQNTRLFVDMAFVEEYLYDFEVAEGSKRRIPRSTTFDLGVEHSFMNQRLFIAAKVKNLTDASVLSEFNRPLPGRSVGIKLRYILR